MYSRYFLLFSNNAHFYNIIAVVFIKVHLTNGVDVDANLRVSHSHSVIIKVIQYYNTASLFPIPSLVNVVVGGNALGVA